MDEYFCHSPFYQLEITTRGKARVCCKMPEVLVSDKQTGREYSVQEDGITKIWESEWMTDLRQRFIDGGKRPECKHCWDDEAAGIISLRQHVNRVPINIQAPVITELVLKMTNKCNCACRICGWALSSLWQSEMEKTNRLHRSSKIIEIESIESNKLNDKNFEDWKKHLHTVTRLSLYGGEPLISEEIISILEYLIEIDRAKEVLLALNTNGTVTSDKVMNLLKQFKTVHLHFSIDDVDERYNYQRWPAKFNNIFDNLKEVHDSFDPSQMEIYIYITVSAFNILTLNDVLTRWSEFSKFEIKLENNIFEPSLLSVLSIPESVKLKIEEYLDQFDWSPTKINFGNKKLDYKQIILNFMNLHKSTYSCKEYLYELNKWLELDDKRRKQDWKTTFPELYQLLINNE